MPIPVQHPNTVNTAWNVYIRTSPFVNLYNIYHRNFESPNREIREYSVIWFRQIWRCINELAGSDLSYGKGIYDVRNDYNPKNPIYGQILYETKKVYNRYDGKYYKILAILHFDFVIPYADNYGGRIVNITENKQYNTMNNTKKRIRLTESKLHRIIKEAINELAPQTYASFAKKLRKAPLKWKRHTATSRDELAHEAELRALDAWNEKYGIDTHNVNGITGEIANRKHVMIPTYGRYSSVGQEYLPQEYRIVDKSSYLYPNGNAYAGEDYYFPHENRYNSNYYGHHQGLRDKDNYETLNDKPIFPEQYDGSYWFGDKDDSLIAAHQMAHPNPENDYRKGKGWKTQQDYRDEEDVDLDESINRAIRRTLR